MADQPSISGVEHNLAGRNTALWIKRIGLALFSAVIMVLLLIVPQLVQAESQHASPTAQWVVNTAVDESDGSCSDGDCSLRDAITLSANGDTISFYGDTTIYLNSQLDLTKTLTIDGSGHAVTVSGDSGGDGSANVRVFNITAGKVVTLSHLSVVKGDADMGGGIYNKGTLMVQDCMLANNVATTSSAGGGAIWNENGTLTLLRTTVVSNTANNSGGGILNRYGTVTLQNSTASGNHASIDSGGGIDSINGSVILRNSTLGERGRQ